MGKQSRREELLDAALAECVENGYAATGVKEITARAAVSHGTFYNYFDNRRELLDVLVTREVEGYMDVLRRAAFSLHPVTEDELRAQMQSVTADLIGLAMNRIDVSAFLLTDVAGVDKETLRRHLRHFHELSGLASEVLANAAAEGLIDESISLEFAGQAWISAILAVVTPAVADDSDVGDVDEVARILTRVLLDGIPTPTA